MSKLSENVIDLSNLLAGFSIYELVYGRWDRKIEEFRTPLDHHIAGFAQTQQSIEARKLIANQLEQDQFGFERMLLTIWIILLIVISYLILNAWKNHQIKEQNISLKNSWVFVVFLFTVQSGAAYLMHTFMGDRQVFLLTTAFVLSDLGYYYYIKNNEIFTLS
jgi:hypothetical protein